MTPTSEISTTRFLEKMTIFIEKNKMKIFLLPFQ